MHMRRHSANLAEAYCSLMGQLNFNSNRDGFNLFRNCFGRPDSLKLRKNALLAGHSYLPLQLSMAASSCLPPGLDVNLL